MSPDELRAAAEKMTSPLDNDDRVGVATDDREWWAALKTARDATRRLADVIEYAEAERARIGRVTAASMYAHGEFDAITEVWHIACGDTANQEKDGQS